MLLAEQLVGQARERRQRRMARRERRVTEASAFLFLACAAAAAVLVPNARGADELLVVGLVAGYAAVSRVRFEFATSFVTPEQLFFIPMLLLLPLPLVPFLVMSAALAAQVPDFVNRSWSRDRWMNCVSDSWFCLGPVVVLACFSPGEPTSANLWVFIVAFGAQLLGDLAWTLLRDRLVDRLGAQREVPYRQILHNYLEVALFDAMLWPFALVVSIAAVDHAVALAALPPIVLLLDTFARERRERYGKTLELQRAYRGTVMLLSDVVEFDDPYTADHSRSVVDLVHSIADEMHVREETRQELEFAALLHDVGKIAIPKDILLKPAKLTAAEFEVMKTHTIEGQLMLDRVGGLLGRVGEIVRSCHERWDGSGYPDGIRGKQIPLEARIVFCADAFNAMTTDRVYRAAMSSDAALEELAAHAGTQFDPLVVDSLIRVIKEGQPEVATTSASDDIRSLLSEHLPHPPVRDLGTGVLSRRA